MKILFAYTGHCRTYRQTLESHLDFILNPLKMQGHDLFVQFMTHEREDIDTETLTDFEFIVSAFKDYKIDIKILNDTEKDYIQEIVQTQCAETHVVHRRGNEAKFGIGTMFYCIENSLKEASNFDLIFKMRPDALFMKAIDTSFVENHFDVCFPTFGHFGNKQGRNDQIFIIRPTITCQPFEILKTKKLTTLHPETLLNESLIKTSGNIIERFEKSIDYVLIQRNGFVNDQRSFPESNIAAS